MDDLAELRALFERLQEAVRALDYDAVQPLIADSALMFGSFENMMVGFVDMRDRQFRHVWPRIGDFTIELDTMRAAVRGDLAWAAFLFHTSAKDENGRSIRREGRMTFVLERRNERFVIVHSHDSLAPARTLGGLMSDIVS